MVILNMEETGYLLKHMDLELDHIRKDYTEDQGVKLVNI